MRNISVCFFTLVALALLASGCARKNIRVCPIETLILEESTFPQGTYAEELISPVPEDPMDSAERSFYYDPDLAYQEVVHWNSLQEAKKYFNLRIKSVFDVDGYMGPWEIPPELKYTSMIADKYRVACGVAHGVYQCRMIATYDQYFVYFRSYVTDQGISLSIFDQLLKAIDAKMTQCLGE